MARIANVNDSRSLSFDSADVTAQADHDRRSSAIVRRASVEPSPPVEPSFHSISLKDRSFSVSSDRGTAEDYVLLTPKTRTLSVSDASTASASPAATSPRQHRASEGSFSPASPRRRQAMPEEVPEDAETISAFDHSLLSDERESQPPPAQVLPPLAASPSVLTSEARPLKSSDFAPRNAGDPIVDIKNAAPPKRVSKWNVAKDILGNLLTLGLYSAGKAVAKTWKADKEKAATFAREVREDFNNLKDESKTIGKSVRLGAIVAADIQEGSMNADGSALDQRVELTGEFIGGGEYGFGTLRILAESVTTAKNQLKASKTLRDFKLLSRQLKDLVERLDTAKREIDDLEASKDGGSDSVRNKRAIWQQTAAQLAEVAAGYDWKVGEAAAAAKTKSDLRVWLTENGLTLGRYLLNLTNLGFKAMGKTATKAGSAIGKATGLYALIAAGIAFYRVHKVRGGIKKAEAEMAKAEAAIQERENELRNELSVRLGHNPSPDEMRSAKDKDVALQFAQAAKRSHEETLSERKAEAISQGAQGTAYLIQGSVQLATMILAAVGIVFSAGIATPIMLAFAGSGAAVASGMYASRLAKVSSRQNKVADLMEAHRQLEEGCDPEQLRRDNPQIARIIDAEGYRREFGLAGDQSLSRDQVKTIVVRELAVFYTNIMAQEVLRNMVGELETSGRPPPRPSQVEAGQAAYNHYTMPEGPTLEMLGRLGLKTQDIAELYYARSVNEGVKALLGKTGLAAIQTESAQEKAGSRQPEALSNPSSVIANHTIET